MTKKSMLAWALGLSVLLVAGGLWASNTGFKLNYPLVGPGDPLPDGGNSQSGRNTIALPYFAQTNIGSALNLIGDIEDNFTVDRVDQISRYVRSNDSLVGYDGISGSDFNLEGGECYQVAMKQSYNYIIVGSHNPGLRLALYGPGASVPGGGNSQSGRNQFAYPYHSTAPTALDLIGEIDGFAGAGTVSQISRYVRSNDTLVGYDGISGNNFNLVPGACYRIAVTTTVNNWAPAHY